jgi:ABC-type glutathione transport system ATPase component
MMLLEVVAVDLHLPGRPGPVLEEVSLGVGAGEILALIGESGSGKSLIARAASGFLPEGARIGGALRVCGVPIGAAGPAGGWGVLRGRAVAHLFQDARRYLHPTLTVGRQIAQVAARHGTRPTAVRAPLAARPCQRPAHWGQLVGRARPGRCGMACLLPRANAPVPHAFR